MYSRQPFDSVVPNGLVVVASARAVKGVTATTASRYFRQARLQAAVTRALLDELERAQGPSWRRYSHDAYGQKDDGAAFNGTGVGRCWPLLTGERGHYELAAGRDPLPFIEAMERFANGGGMLLSKSGTSPRERGSSLVLLRARPCRSAGHTLNTPSSSEVDEMASFMTASTRHTSGT